MFANRISEILAEIETPGTFATSLSAPADELSIEVCGVDQLQIPIKASTAAGLLDVADPSPFGWRDKTLHDESVRSSWEIPASRVKVSRTWTTALRAYLEVIREELGLPDECELVAELNKLLIYHRGQFFRPHQDSERSDDMVGSLVAVLPSKCSGADCKNLAEFLVSEEVALDWPLNKERRQQIHQQLDRNELPVRHTTLRKGRPYTLRLQKDESLFTREATHRKALQKSLKVLRRADPERGSAKKRRKN